MSNLYSSLCDDFGLSTYVLGKVDMPTGRETVLHFFDATRKTFPSLNDFEKRDNGEYSLEEDRDAGAYRWTSLDARRFCAGYVNPPALEDADEFNEKLLEMGQYHLDLGTLTTEAVDVLCYFDFLYQGNHDEVVAEALAVNTPLEGLAQMPGGRVLNYQPSLLMALDENCYLQGRMTIETRTNPYQVRTGQFPEAPLSVYFTVRQFWSRSPYKNFIESYRNQRRVLDELVTQYVVPNVVQPLQKVIGAKQ